MNYFDEAEAMKGMIEMKGATQQEMARLLSVSQSYIANKLRLLKFSEEERAAILAGGLSERHARALLRLTDGEARAAALKRVTERGLTVAETERLVDCLHDAEAPKRIGSATKLSYVESFKENLKASIATLTSLGITANEHHAYHGSRVYITVMIEEAP